MNWLNYAFTLTDSQKYINIQLNHFVKYEIYFLMYVQLIVPI